MYYLYSIPVVIHANVYLQYVGILSTCHCCGLFDVVIVIAVAITVVLIHVLSVLVVTFLNLYIVSSVC